MLNRPLWQRGFLNPAELGEILTGLSTAPSVRTGILSPGNQLIRDESARQTSRLSLPEPLSALVSYRLMSFRPELETFFRRELIACQPPQFLAYGPGDFYQRHVDVIRHPQKLSRIRHLSIVIFLNAPPAYTGGELVLYADGGPTGETCQGGSGDLVAFLPEWQHEVRPVLSGQRYSIVSWYY